MWPFYEVKSRGFGASVESVKTFASIPIYLFTLFLQETNAKVVYEDQAEIAVFVVCFIICTCHWEMLL